MPASGNEVPAESFISNPSRPEEFIEIKEEAEQIGFLGVLAGPLVRSSYRAGRLWAQSMVAKGRAIPSEMSGLADASLGFAQAVS